MKLSIKVTLGILVVAAIAVAVGFAFTQRSRAPNVEFVTLSGHNFTTADLRGKVVLVNFWATSCSTCVHEMPMLVRTQKEFGSRGYVTVAVAMSYDNPNYVAAFAQENRLPFKVALDSRGKIAKAFGNVMVTPTSFLLDKNGHILKQYLGEPNPKAFHALINRALAQPVTG